MEAEQSKRQRTQKHRRRIKDQHPGLFHSQLWKDKRQRGAKRSRAGEEGCSAAERAGASTAPTPWRICMFIRTKQTSCWWSFTQNETPGKVESQWWWLMMVPGASRPSPGGLQSSQVFCPTRQKTLSPGKEGSQVSVAYLEERNLEDWVWTPLIHVKPTFLATYQIPAAPVLLQLKHNE